MNLHDIAVPYCLVESIVFFLGGKYIDLTLPVL